MKTKENSLVPQNRVGGIGRGTRGKTATLFRVELPPPGNKMDAVPAISVYPSSVEGWGPLTTVRIKPNLR